jgi:hypothetical protein
MAKRGKDTITIGSAKAYMMVVEDAMPTKDDLFKDENRVGHIKGGAALEYTEETYEEKDDLGLVSKIITVSEEALLKMGLITWNGETLTKLIDRCKVEEASGVRTVKIGGAGNAQGKYYAIGLHHEDKKDGDIWVIIKGRNTAGVTLTLAADEGTLLEPEFKAVPHDEDGTLVELIEESAT